MENQEKIYGIYPGSIADTQKIENLSEVDLYFAIDGFGPENEAQQMYLTTAWRKSGLLKNTSKIFLNNTL